MKKSRKFQVGRVIIIVAVLILTSFLVANIVKASVDACSEPEKYQECLRERGECQNIFSVCVREKLNGSCSFENDTYYLHYPKCFPTCLSEYEEGQICIKNNQDKYGYDANEAYCVGGPQGGSTSCQVTSSTTNASVSSSSSNVIVSSSNNVTSISAEISQLCTICPVDCELNNQSNITCGECVCPLNYGFCSESSLRDEINETLTYCYKGLWQKQKQDNESCQNNFECLSNFCSKNVCYDISLEVKQTKSILQTILDWIKSIFHI